jgi:hypothetical protein
MVKKLSRDDTRDDDAISELSRKLPKSFSLSLSLSLANNERKRRRRKRNESRRRRERDGQKETGRPTKVLLIRAE